MIELKLPAPSSIEYAFTLDDDGPVTEDISDGRPMRVTDVKITTFLEDDGTFSTTLDMTGHAVTKTGARDKRASWRRMATSASPLGDAVLTAFEARVDWRANLKATR